MSAITVLRPKPLKPRPLGSTITLMLISLTPITLITLIIRVIGAPWLLQKDIGKCEQKAAKVTDLLAVEDSQTDRPSLTLWRPDWLLSFSENL